MNSTHQEKVMAEGMGLISNLLQSKPLFYNTIENS